MNFKDHTIKIKNKLKHLSNLQKISAFFLLLACLGTAIYFFNPQKKLIELRNSQRRSDVVNILNAVYKYYTDNSKLPDSITSEPKKICVENAKSCDGMVDISEVIKETKIILSEVPVDPKVEDENSTGYEISKTSNGRIKISAPLAEKGAVITLSK